MRFKYQDKILLAFLLIVFSISMFFSSMINSTLEPYFLLDEKINILRNLLVTLSGALISSMPIAFSFIMFAMQVNIERMPYGLFRKFSSDKILLTYFLVTFVLALAVGFLAIITKPHLVGVVIVGLIWSVFFIVLFLLFTYKRALLLVNPSKQLSFIFFHTKNDLQYWSKAADRISPSLENYNNELEKEFNHDSERHIYFLLFPQWINSTKTAFDYIFSLARYHASQGDYDVSQMALNTIVDINAEYIQAKGKTFFSSDPLYGNNLSNDIVINETLENFRKYIQAGVSRGDEQQITQSFHVMKKLCTLYLYIDYSNIMQVKTHANLAIAYLTDAIESIVPHGLVDIVITGIHLLGLIATKIIEQDDIEEITRISEKISLIARASIINQKTYPIVYKGVQELANLTFNLLKRKSKVPLFIFPKVNQDILSIAKSVLKENFSSKHSEILSFYYSITRYETFGDRLTKFANAILEAKEDDESAKIAIANIEQWAINLYAEKELLLIAIEKKSDFIFDSIYWIVQITNILLTVSTAKSCKIHYRQELIKHASWLIDAFSYIPANKDAIDVVENYHLTDQIFFVAVEAHKLNCFPFCLDMKDLLFSWSLKLCKFGKKHSAIHAFHGLICLNIIFNLDDISLINETVKKMNEETIAIDVRRALSEKLKKMVDLGTHNRFSSNYIDAAMTQIDQKKLQILLSKLSKAFED